MSDDQAKSAMVLPPGAAVVLSTPKNLSDESADKLKAAVAQAFQGLSPSQVLILSDGMAISFIYPPPPPPPQPDLYDKKTGRFWRGK